MKVFVVTSGEYSDYRINGIFSTEEKAEEGKKFFSSDEIYEEEVDTIPDHPKGMFWFEVDMTKEGFVRSCKITNGVYAHKDLWRHYGDDECVVFYMWARDEKHAIKIANERRTQLIVTNAWTTDWDKWGKTN